MLDEKLRVEMAVRQMDIKTLAHKAGLHRESVSRLVRGIETNPRIDTVIRLANVLRINSGWLIEDMTIETTGKNSNKTKPQAPSA